MSFRALIRRLVPPGVRKRIRWIQYNAGALVPDCVKRAVWKVVVALPVLPDLYYVFSGAFRREHRAVLRGKLQHITREAGKLSDGARFTSRRSIRRLEKGLIAWPRRPVFAVGHIEETLDLLELLAAAQGPDSDACDRLLCAWATNTISQCFSAVSSHPVLDRARCRVPAPSGANI